MRARGDEDMGEVLADARACARRPRAPMVPVLVGLTSKRMSVVESEHQRMEEVERVAAGCGGAAPRQSRDVPSSAAVSGVSRRNSARRKALDRAARRRRSCPGSRPRPRHGSTRPIERPSTVKTWMRLPNASSMHASRQSGEMSIRQLTTNWPSWLRGVSRRIWIAARRRLVAVGGRVGIRRRIVQGSREAAMTAHASERATVML